MLAYSFSMIFFCLFFFLTVGKSFAENILVGENKQVTHLFTAATLKEEYIISIIQKS
jgi:hypothetical protein